MNLWERVVSRLLVDPLVRSGRVPLSGPVQGLIRRCARSRVIRCPENHPLARVLSHDEWKPPFSISDHSVIWIYQWLQRATPRSILELGSGMSTLAFAEYARQRRLSGGEPPRIVSIDHDEHWLELTRDRLKWLELDSLVDLRHCPLGPCGTQGEQGQWYTAPVEELATIFSEGLDCLLVDGPPSAVGRFAALPQLGDLLSPTATVLVDDAFRESEQQMIERWLRWDEPRLELAGVAPLGSGLGVLQRR